MTQRVGVEFDGRSRGAVGAAKEAAAAVQQFTRSARESSPPLQGMERDLGKLTRGAIAGSGAFHGLGRSVAFASSGFLGGFGLAAAVRGAANELTDSIKVNAQVQAVLRATGGVAGVTAKHLDELANAQLRKTGADDELVKKAGAVLLTFRSVRDVAGQGNDVFDQAIKLSGDLAVIFGTDLPAAAMQLGKALQDPITGMTALRRSGISFDEQQRKQIKTLVEHGKLLEAQKIILQEVAREVGGTAAKVGDAAPWMRLKETIKNLSAEGIKPLLPEIDSLTGKVQKWADELANNKEAQAALKKNVQEAVGVVKDFAEGADKVAGALGGWKRTAEILLALKVVGILGRWTQAVDTLIGTEAARTGLAGAAGSAGVLRARLLALTRLGPIIIPVGIAYFTKKYGADAIQAALNPFETLGDDIAGDVTKGKNPYPMGTSRWYQWERQHGHVRAGDPTTVEGGSPVHAGSGPLSFAQRVDAPTAGLTALQKSLPGAKGDASIGYSGHAKKSYHYAGEALDIGDGGNPASLISDWNYLYPRRHSFAELIWDPPAEVQAKAPGSGAAYFWGIPGGFSGHRDHIHVAFTGNAADIGKLQSAVARGKDKGADPPTSGGTSTASKNPIPLRIRTMIAVADEAAAAAARSAGKTDDIAAIRAQRKALEEEITFLQQARAKATGERFITLTDLLTSAETSLKGLDPAKKAGGAGISTIMGMRAAITESLRTQLSDLGSAGGVLDQAGLETVSKLQALRDHLKVGLSAKDLATTRASITHWGNVLKDSIAEQAKLASAAAQEGARLWQRSWTNDVAKVLRDFDENVAAPQLAKFEKDTGEHLELLKQRLVAQLKAFDLETKKGLKALASPVETPEEAALRLFMEGRAADDRARQRADLTAQIADTQKQLDELGSANGIMIDIATGLRTPLTQDQVVTKREGLQKQLRDLQRQYDGLGLDDQERALKAAADLSRRAADDRAQAAQEAYQQERDDARAAVEAKAADEQQAYQEERATLKQHLQDKINDERTALSQNLEDWNLWLESKKRSYAEFIKWLGDNGLSTDGIVPPSGESSAGIFKTPGAISRAQGGFAFAKGGRVPGPRYGPEDTVMARLSGGETVIDRRLTAALEDMVASGGYGGYGGPSVVATTVKLNDYELARVLAPAIDAEMSRLSGYTIQRG